MINQFKVPFIFTDDVVVRLPPTVHGHRRPTDVGNEALGGWISDGGHGGFSC